MNENKTSKYFKYAIGEIILVVIGILIALQINNWNENRKERKQAFQYLSEFKKDIISDTIQYNFVIAAHSKNIQAHIALLSKVKITLNDIENMITSLGSTYYSRKINLKTFQKTQNNGTSNLLGFEDLYDMLSNYYTETSRALIYQCDWEVKDFDKNRALFENFINENNHEIDFLNQDFKNEYQIDSFPKIKQNQEDFFILTFINSVRGRNYIRNALNRHSYMKNHYEKYRDEALTLLKEIDKAIASYD